MWTRILPTLFLLSIASARAHAQAGPPMTYGRDGNAWTLRNSKYQARIDGASGVVRVHRLNRNGGTEDLAFESSRLSLTSRGQSVSSDDLPAQGIAVSRLDFYGRFVVESRAFGGSLLIRRTYEFTRSSNIWEQIELYAESDLTLDQALWTFAANTSRVAARAVSQDLFVRRPSGQYGGTPIGTNQSLPGENLSRSRWLAGDPVRSVGSSWMRPLVYPGQPLEMKAGWMLLSNTAISINSDVEPPLDFRSHDDRFFPGYGIRYPEDWDGKTREFSFLTFAQYVVPLAERVPIQAVNPAFGDTVSQREDSLIRYTMHLLDRIAFDGGWLRIPGWPRDRPRFPDGDAYSQYTRIYASMLYLWAHLTLVSRAGGGWQHVAGDADLIYRVLQSSKAWFSHRQSLNFLDLMDGRLPYIAYSAQRKEKDGFDVRGVINSHVGPMHFIWLMAEASQLAGDGGQQRQWLTLLSAYYGGTRKLFERCYRHRSESDKLYALPSYSTTQDVHQGFHYTRATYQELPAPYLHFGQFEPEFVDIVERASQGDFNPFDEKIQGEITEPLVGRLWRTFPVSLAFSHSDHPSPGAEVTNNMAHVVQCAGLSELLSYEPRRKEGSIHNDANRYIVEGDGRKWILTSARFRSYWTPGQWEERDRASVPADRRFEVAVRYPSGVQGVWAAYLDRTNRIRIMTNRDASDVEIVLPTNRSLRSAVVQHRQSSGAWQQPPVRLSSGPTVRRGGGITRVYLGRLPRKSLLTLLFE